MCFGVTTMALTHFENEVVTMLKAVGLRVTPQRDAILRHILVYRGHSSADDIYRSIHERWPNISVSTVYNTLKSFSEAGLVKEIKFGDGASLFDANTYPHHHMLCVQCGQLTDFYLPEMPDLTSVAKELCFQIDECQLEVRGVCAKCQDIMKS